MFTHVIHLYLCLPLVTHAYSCLPMFTTVYLRLYMFTHACYPSLPMFTALFTLVNLCFPWSRTFELDNLSNCDNFYYCVHHVYSTVIIVLGIMDLYHDTYGERQFCSCLQPTTATQQYKSYRQFLAIIN